jgi:DNA-binding winged helix-turn-helix (wHTH) protein/TolB-like protein/Tfp pilus assembly protein PilF
MSEPQIQIYEFGEYRADVTRRLLTKGIDENIPITPKVFDTLLYLVRHGGKVVGKDELMREIWTDTIVEENNLNQNISILRRIFGEKPGEHRFIVTVPGQGYRFVPEVSEVLTSEFEDSNSIEPAKGLSASPTESYSGDNTPTGDRPKVENREPESAGLKKKRLPPAVIFAAIVAGSLLLLLLGFYFWRPVADAPIKTIAVLPFKPLVPEKRNEALEMGMADTLISKLSGGEEISVRPLSAIRRYGSPEQDALAAGRELGVESVLDGTIQNWGDRIRVSAKLLRTRDGKQLWASQFDEKFTDIFVLQDSISERVAAALKIRLASSEKKHQTENVEAYQLFMRGRYHYGKLTPAEIESGIPYFQQAIDLDPNYALAYSHLSMAYRTLAIAGEKPASEVMPQAKASALKAIALDDRLAQAHGELGAIMFWNEWDWAGAENQYKRALELDPNSADVHLFYAHLLSNTGRHTEALAEVKRARELDPLDLGTNALEGQFLNHAGRTDEALDRLRKTMQLEPNFWMPHFFAASAYIEKGMYPEAVAESKREKALTGGNGAPYGAVALAKSGNRAEAQAVLDELLKLSNERYISPYNIALIYNALGETDKTFEWLEKSYTQRGPQMTFLKVEPKWNNLRNEPRFADLMKRMNFGQ